THLLPADYGRPIRAASGYPPAAAAVYSPAPARPSSEARPMSATEPVLTRRDLLAVAALPALGFASPLIAAHQPAPAPAPPLNRSPRMVQEYFVRQVRAAEQRGNEARAALKTAADAAAYVADVRKKIAACFGPFPEKTPLNPKVTGKVDRDAYTIEKVIF